MYWEIWAEPEYVDLEFKHTLSKTYLRPEYLALFEITQKMVMCCNGNFGNFTTEKFRVMMAIHDEATTMNWNTFIFNNIKEEVQKNAAISTTGKFSR